MTAPIQKTGNSIQKGDDDDDNNNNNNSNNPAFYFTEFRTRR